MNDPVLVEVLRGPLVESRHCGAIAVHDADGREVFALGAVDRPVYPRSAIKLIQALPLVESGAADHYGLTHAQLALACASHGGEPAHVETAAAMLHKAGLDGGALECGAHWPMHQKAAYALAGEGETPTALHNNCSGKHAGFLCLACHTGLDHQGYVAREHGVQTFVAEAIEVVTDTRLDAAVACGTDGCSIPTYAIPLNRLATGFARMGAGTLREASKNRAASRLMDAIAAEPFMVAGTDRFCTGIMALFGRRAIVKTGAEGIFCAAFPDEGLGIAIKCADGHSRAAEVMMAAMIDRFLPLDEAGRLALQPFLKPVFRNWNGIEVGGLRPTASLLP